MTITIHRGSRQIGGCATEIATQKSRIFIDFGTQLPDLEGDQPPETLSIPGLTEAPARCDGVFFTHYHGDHLGNLPRILPEIPCYMGAASRAISLALQGHLQAAHQCNGAVFSDNSPMVQALRRMVPYQAGSPVICGDIKVTPYRVDHSAFDAYLFLVEAEGKRILHTGDFRDHGYTGETLAQALKEIGKTDALICEGTMLSRPGEKVLTEAELEEKAREIMRDHKKVFVLCSSTNIDRIRAFYRAVPDDRPVICDTYQEKVLDAVKETAYGEEYQFDGIDAEVTSKSDPAAWQETKQFLMFVRNNDRFRDIMALHRGTCKVIYSQWSGYLQKSSVRSFLEGFDYTILHTSGHAAQEAIGRVVQAVDPTVILPIHTEDPAAFSDLFGTENVHLMEDGCPFPL